MLAGKGLSLKPQKNEPSRATMTDSIPNRVRLIRLHQ